MGRAVLLVVVLAVVPVAVGGATWALASLVLGDDVEAGSVASTTPDQPGTTVLAPGGRVLVTPGGSFPGVPGTAPTVSTPPPTTTPPSLPEGWPAGLAPPEGADFRAATNDGPGGRQLVVNYGSDVPGGPLADLLDAQLRAAGFTITGGYRDPEGKASSIQAASPQFEANVAVSDIPPGTDQPPRIVTIVLRPTG